MRKESTKENLITEWDVCMLHINRFPNMFVRINWIWPDEKMGWWKVNITRLALPLESFTWKLDDNHIACEEFTMDGVPMQFQVLPRPDLEAEDKERIKKEQKDKLTSKSKSSPEDVSDIVDKVFNVDRPKVVSLFGAKINVDTSGPYVPPESPTAA